MLILTGLGVSPTHTSRRAGIVRYTSFCTFAHFNYNYITTDLKILLKVVVRNGVKMSNFCFANFQKNHSNSVTNLQREANREFEDPKRYKNDVRLEKSDQNFYFTKSENWGNSIDDILEKYGIKKRKDSVVLTTTIYGFSEGWEAALYAKGLSQESVEEQKKQYFQKCFEFENTRGKCINFVVHVDEAGMWHAHAATVPITEVPIKKMKPVLDKDGNPKRLKNDKLKYDYDYKKDAEGNILKRYALNAKAIFGSRRKMSEEQTRFYESCGKPFGMERGECRIDDDEEDRRKHMTEVEYRITKRAEEKGKKIVDDARDTVLKMKEEEREKLRAANRTLREANQQAEKIISDAQEQAKEEAEKIINNAYEESERIKQVAKKQADEELKERERKAEEREAQNARGKRWIEEENKRLDEKRAQLRKEARVYDTSSDIADKQYEEAASTSKPNRRTPYIAY